MTLAALPLAMRRWLALLSGAALPLAFAPFQLWWLAPVLVGVLFLLWLDVTPREAAGHGFAFGFGAFVAGTWWLYISIHVVGGAPPALAVFVMLLLMMLMAAYFALAGWLAGRLTGRPGLLACLLVMPGALVLTEWLRGWVFTGFPWLTLGYAQLDGPLSGVIPLGGVYAASLLTAGLAGALALLVAGELRQRIAAAALLAMLAGSALALGGRDYAEPAGPPLRVALVQGDVAQERKWLPEELARTMDLYRDLTLGVQGADIVVWPEAAIPALAHQVEDFLDEMATHAVENGYALLTGILIFDFLRREFSNSLISLGATPGVYDKRHLVPFGEYFPVPQFVRDYLRLLDLPYQDITPGPRRQPPLRAGDVLLAPGICYEAAFGGQLRDFLPEAELLVNVSNDGWFGDTIAPHQHLQKARTRALETGRYMLRATNTGVTAIIAPDGSVTGRIPQFEVAVLEGEVVPMQGETPFVRAGNLPAVTMALLLLVAGGTLRHLNPAL
ncbi:MAG: apolipoprotein N-acyltransferase [Chromatiales bacterium]|nr:apolipoprotein N-acyltransferase [Chromatiales bacterium]